MDPNQRPPLPTATDVAQAGNPAVNDIESLIAQADAAVGDASFTQGLAARRENLARLTGETQRVQQFGESPEFQANIQRMRELAPTAGPSSVLSSIIGTQEAQRGILSQAAQKETAGLNALNSFLNTALGVVEYNDQKAQKLANDIQQNAQQERVAETEADLYFSGLKELDDISDAGRMEIKTRIDAGEKAPALVGEGAKILQLVLDGQQDFEKLSLEDKIIVKEEANKQGIIIPTDSEEEEQISRTIIETQLLEMKEILDSMITNRIAGPVGNALSFIGLDRGKKRQLEQKANLIAPMVAQNIQNLGRLSDQDFKIALSTLPGPTDTPDEIQKKVDTLIEIMEQKYGPIGGSGKIKVRRKSDGQTGLLDSEEEFDPELYERIQ